MNYDNEQKIDELLNGFADGELTSQEQEQVRRLIGEDREIARRLREIERCRILVNSLPSAEPSPQLAAGIRRLIHGHTNRHIENVRGVRELFVRKVLAASILVGLFGVLAAVIFHIAGPANVKLSVASEVDTAAETAALEDAAIGVYSLRLHTADFTGVDAFVRKLLSESPWLKYETKKDGPGLSSYRVFCSKGSLEALMSDLAAVWSKFDSETLIINAGDTGRFVTVEDVSPEQVSDIAGKNTFDERIRLAKDFAVLNSVKKIMPEQTTFALMDKPHPELIPIPKPVLTSGQRDFAVAPKGADDRVCVDLNIIISKN